MQSATDWLCEGLSHVEFSCLLIFLPWLRSKTTNLL